MKTIENSKKSQIVLWEQGVAGSNPATPTKKGGCVKRHILFLFTIFIQNLILRYLFFKSSFVDIIKLKRVHKSKNRQIKS